MNRRTSAAVTVLLAVLMLAGVSLLLYPTISELWNSYHQSKAVVTYAETVSDMETAAKAQLREAAQAYNAELAAEPSDWRLTEQEREVYESLLDVTGTGIMGYIEIPSIKVSLPVYHGTEETVLQSGAGHLEGSSLPVGGESTHSVLSGHRGLPSAKLFTDLDKLAEGDVFYLHVLDETLAYKVDQILTVEPDELEALEIEPGQDLCTLVTCTPYGINSHRLLVRGHRIESAEEDETGTDIAIKAPADSQKSGNALLWAVVVALVLTVTAAALVLVFGKKKSGAKGGKRKKNARRKRRRKRKRKKRKQSRTSATKEEGR